MNKKAQITVFIILGIIVLITGGIIVYVRTTSVEKEEIEPVVMRDVPVERDAIINYIQECINQESKPLIKEIGRQGGTLDHSYPYRVYPGIAYNESEPYLDSVTGLTTTDLIPYYYAINYTYFCTQQGNKGCVSSLIIRKTMQEELNDAIKKGLESCINLEQFEDRGYKVVASSKEVITTIGSEEVNVILSFPLTISKEESVVEINDFASVIKSDLGKLYDLAVNITNNEITKGYFNEDEWMRAHGGEIQIEKHKPYPDTIYSLKKYNKKTNQETIFNFAIQDEDTVSLIGQPTPVKVLNPYCNMPDGSCYANSDGPKCVALGGVSSPAALGHYS